MASSKSAARKIGVHITEVASGDEIYSYRGDESFIIASNTKLFTTSAALDALGPGFFHETPFLARGEIVDGVLHGDVAVIGKGDPNFSGRHAFGDSYAIFRRWSEALAQLGVRRVAGQLLLVDGYFEDGLIHPDWPKDQLDRWYEAPVSALSFNDNCLLMRVWPGRSAGGSGRAEIVPHFNIFELRNQTQTTTSSAQHLVSMSRDPDSDTFRAGGRVYTGSRHVDYWLSVDDPVRYFGAALEKVLADEGVVLAAGSRRLESLPAGDWRTVAVHRTDLLTTLNVINKRSQNFYAESLLKTLGAEVCSEGTWISGLRAVNDFLHTLGLDTRSVQLADGSGMSRNNRSSPRQLTHLLRAMHGHRWGREFIRTLPYSGETDLSWRKRLAKPPYLGNVFAKTGGLRGVTTLSGYAKGRSGKLYAFSILLNQTNGGSRAKAAQDKILRALIDHG